MATPQLQPWQPYHRSSGVDVPGVDLVVRARYDLVVVKPVTALFRPSKLNDEAACSLFVKLGESTSANVFNGQPDLVSLDRRVPSVVVDREALYARLSAQQAALEPTLVDGFPSKNSSLVLAIPMRMIDGDDLASIAEDMLAVGSYAAVQQHCVGYDRLMYLLQLLWTTPADPQHEVAVQRRSW